jgi:hypothetical protein
MKQHPKSPKQLSFASYESAQKKRVTRREKFLAEMEQVVPWLGTPRPPTRATWRTRTNCRTRRTMAFLDAGYTGVDKRPEVLKSWPPPSGGITGC